MCVINERISRKYTQLLGPFFCSAAELSHRSMYDVRLQHAHAHAIWWWWLYIQIAMYIEAQCDGLLARPLWRQINKNTRMNYVYEYTRHTSIWYPIIPYMCFIIHRTYNDTLEYLLRFTSMWNISRYYFTHTIMPNAFRFPIPFDKPIKLRDLCVPMPECVIVCVCMRILHQYNECTIATHAFRWLTQGNRYVSQGEYT